MAKKAVSYLKELGTLGPAFGPHVPLCGSQIRVPRCPAIGRCTPRALGRVGGKHLLRLPHRGRSARLLKSNLFWSDICSNY